MECTRVHYKEYVRNIKTKIASGKKTTGGEQEIMSEIQEITKNKSISHKMQDLLDKIKSSVLHTREIYEEFVESARLEGFSDYEIDLILKENLKGIVPERTLSYYRKEYLQLEDKSKKKKEDIEVSSVRFQQVAGIDDKKVIEESSSFTPNPELEAFRQEKGKLVEPSDDDYNTFALPQEEQKQEVICDNPTKKIIKQYDELKAKYEQVITPFEVKKITIVKGQELPFIVKVDPYKRSVTSLELDQKEIKKLMEF